MAKGRDEKVVILGAGLAGLSAAYHLAMAKRDYVVFEKGEAIGGLCRSRKVDGFTFDFDGHLLHFRHRYTLSLIEALMKGNLARHRRSSWIYSHGTYTRYPFQANLFGLPPKVNRDCLMGLINARFANGFNTKNLEDNRSFEDWILHTFGEGIARHFMIPYNTKFWTVSPSQLTCEWIDGFIPLPTLEDTIEGALCESRKDFGYNATFWYPLRGGIEEVALNFASQLKNVHTDSEAVKVDIANKRVYFRNGRVEPYDFLISTLPLPELVNLLEEPPDILVRAIERLRWTSIFNLNLGLDRQIFRDKHWIYFPEKDFVFYRVGFFSSFSSSLAPEGKSSLYAEVSYSPRKPIDRENIIRDIIDDLIKAKILSNYEEIVTQCFNDFKYGYILYDRNYSDSRRKVLDFLTQHHILSIGRYGRWKYMSMEGSILDGKATAGRLAG
jgi:protoporphyrinogen oxidase